MNLTPDERAALERYRKFATTNTAWSVDYGYSDEHYCDRITLADAMLRLVPADDGEPIDAAWMLASGFTQIGEDLFAIDIWRSRTFSMDGPDESGTSLVYSLQGEAWVKDLYDLEVSEGGWSHGKRRGDVSRLMSALGIKEQPNGN